MSTSRWTRQELDVDPRVKIEDDAGMRLGGGFFGGGRSPFLAASPEPVEKRRHYALRASILATITLLLTAGPLILHFQLVQPVGPGWLLYWGHDSVYLPLRAWLWGAWFPWGLIVWLPVLGVTLLALIETITGISLLRRLQRWTIRRLATHRSGQRLLNAWHRIAGAGAFRARYIEIVVATLADSQLSEYRLRWLCGAEPGNYPALVDLVTLKFRLMGRFATGEDIQALACAGLDAVLKLGEGRGDASADFAGLADLVDSIEGYVSRVAEDGDPPKSTTPSRRTPPGWLTHNAVELCTHYFTWVRGRIGPDPGWSASEIVARRLALASVAAHLEGRRFGRYAPPYVETDPARAGAAAALILGACVGIACRQPGLADDVAFLTEEADRLRFAGAWCDRPEQDPALGLAKAFARAGDFADLAFQATLLESRRYAAVSAGEPLLPLVLDVEDLDWAAWRARGEIWSAVGPTDKIR